jgi:hypothetical protein
MEARMSHTTETARDHLAATAVGAPLSETEDVE